jgi:Tfp pilus assembly protein PilX
MHKRRLKKNKRGVTLLITMLVLILLATMIVQFQSDASLQVRADSYRIDELQCRYAAESALVSTPMLITDVLAAAAQAAQAAQSPQTSPGQTPAAAQEPNAASDSSAASDPNGPPPQKPWPFLVAERTMTIGEAKIEIKVHDETAKWPMLWLFRSPFDASLGNTADPQRCFTRYTELMNIESQKAQESLALAQKLGKPLQLPKADFTMRKTAAPKTGGQAAKTQGQSFKARWQRKNLTQRTEDLYKRKTVMGTFALRWGETMRTNPDFSWLKEPLADRKEAFEDFLGKWGSDRININLASAELITSVFEPLGMTEEMAWAIVRYREKKPFAQASSLSDVEEVPENVTRSIQNLCVTAGDTYSVFVTARLGRAHCTLVGGLYIDDRQQFKVATAIPGE